MNNLKYSFVAVMLLLSMTFQSAEAKRKVVPRVYLFGFAASFNDTIVHFTNVMEVDSVWMDKKFLLGREHYSHQLRDYLADKKELPHRTCVTMFAKDRQKAEKMLIKMKRLYTQSKDGRAHFDVRYLDDDEFRFKTVNIMEYEWTEGDSETIEKPQKPKKGKFKVDGKKPVRK